MRPVLNVISGMPAEERRSARDGWGIRDLLLIAVPFVALAVVVPNALRAERRTLQQLDPQTRAGLVARTLDDLRSACGHSGPTAPREWCRRQAEFALQLPECDGACQATAHEILRVSPR